MSRSIPTRDHVIRPVLHLKPRFPGRQVRIVIYRPDARCGSFAFMVFKMSSFNRWFRKSSLVRVVGGFTLAALVLAGIGWLVTGPYRDYPLGFDTAVRIAIRQMRSPMWASLFLTVTKLGSTLYLAIIGAAAGIVFIFMRWFRPLFLLILVMSGQAALHHGFKWLIARPRPPALIDYPTAENFSYPSGHAVASLCLYLTISWVVARQFESPAEKA